MLKRTVILTVQPLVANRVYTVRQGLAKGLKRRGGLGFLPRRLPPEEVFLQTLDFEGRTVYDIGGYEGIFTLFFASRVGPAGRLITFEPNPRNCAKIAENVALNRFTNVEVRQIAVGARPGRAALVFPPHEEAYGSLVGDIQAEIRRHRPVVAIDVEIDSIDRQIARGTPAPDFVKIDVEGFELDVLRGMRDTIAVRRPALYVEVHGADPQRKLENATAIVEYLWQAGYSIRHVETGTSIDDASTILVARRGHLYCV
jgi:FkbM family methyltransferase